MGVVFYNKNNIKSSPLLTTLPSSTSTIITRITPTTNLYTGDWKTCKNKKYGYQFKYPPHWQVAGECSSSKKIGLTSTTTQFSVNGKICSPQIDIYFTPNKEITEWNNPNRVVDDQYIIDISGHYSVRFAREYNVDGKRWFVSEASKEYPCQPLYPMTVAYNNGLLTFNSESVSDTILEAILSTFKFIQK